MDNHDTSHRRNHTTQSIPLQNLTRPPEGEDDDQHLSHPHRRTLSDRGRRLFLSSPSRRRPNADRGTYAALDEHHNHEFPRHSTLRPIPADDRETDGDLEELSPLTDMHAFQNAVSFPGFASADDRDFRPVMSASALPTADDHLAYLTGANDSSESLSDFGYDDTRSVHNAFHDEDDTAPLTENSQPLGMTTQSAPQGQRHDRLSVRFTASPTPHIPSTSRLGDDLDTIENGLSPTNGPMGRSGSRLGSLSPSSAASPLRRASTIVRNVSQRVVNLSNEPEVAEQNIRRRQSQKIRSQQPRQVPDTSYTHDGSTALPAEKVLPTLTPIEVHDNWVVWRNPLKGKTLGIFSPDNPIRTRLCDFLVHPITEPTILLLIVLQAILVAVDASPSVFAQRRIYGWGQSGDTAWIDYAMLALFSIYTFEIAARSIVSGFIINPLEYSTINRSIGWKAAMSAWFKTLFSVQPEEMSSAANTPATAGAPGRSIIRAFTAAPSNPDYHAGSRQQARIRLGHRAYLRHSFNRLDFIAVVSYWISFVLSLANLETHYHLYVFHMMSSLRVLRLLSLTSGTSIILRSLKKAAPLLLNVALLIGFFWLLFAIIGVQSFKSSLRRTCVWTDPGNSSNVYNNYQQYCGGSVDANGKTTPWYINETTTAQRSKGFLCPPNSRCISTSNPYNGTVSFDNIAQSIELVFVLMTSNTYSDIMYYLTDSDYLFAAVFFAGGTIVMTFWLVNLLIAVITTSFQVIREQSKTSAFANQAAEDLPAEDDEILPRKNRVREIYERFSWIWVVVIAYGLICQCLRSAEMSNLRTSFVNLSETVVTLILLAEIVVRFAVDPRHFFSKRQNSVDLALAIITTVIQIPVIHDSGQPYAWLTFFQIIRVYRVVLAVPFTRDLLVLVVGNLSGLLNLILFVLLLTFFGALFASQLFRGQVPEVDGNGNTLYVTFATIYNSFLGMYQILSSENWTTILYSVTANSVEFHTAWIGAIFIILWITLAFFIVLNMFIAVIQENFDVSEDEKRVQQVRAFLQRKELGASSNATLSLSAMFRLRQLAGRRQDPLDYGQALMDQLLKPEVAQTFLEDNSESAHPHTPATGPKPRPTSMIVHTGPFGFVRTKLARFLSSEPNPFYSRLKFSRIEEEIDPRSMAQEVVSAADARKKAQREYLKKFPTYNVSLYLFGPDNWIRRRCQRIVGPGRGSERFNGNAPSPIVFFIFSAFLYLAIVGMVVLACITTPLFQRHYFLKENHSNSESWFLWADLGFAILFTIEGVIRVIADGFFFTPHAYLRSSWGLIDGIVLLTLWINVIATFQFNGDISRGVGAFKALRALRLLNISDSARDTFHSVIVRGGWKVLSAAFVSLSLLIPFAIYGLNLFNGKLTACNDNNSNIYQLADCVNEYSNTPFEWDVISPRAAANPWFDFDNFGNSLLILFSIVSQEGWINVMWATASITGFRTQPSQMPGSLGYTVFFVIFNLLGAVFVLTLFVSVFMRNYTEQTGVAFLTAEQRSWLELRKLLRQIAPSKRPISLDNMTTIRKWCYTLAKKKTGRWQRFVTVVLTFHLVLLCTEFYPAPDIWDDIRTYVFLGLTVFYVANIVIRIIGLSWTRFRKNAWDVFGLLAVSGTLVSTILYLTSPVTPGHGQIHTVWEQMHKLFLVAIVLLLIPRNNQLDQLLKTAAASLTAIANLLATWLVLFLVYAIAFTQAFGLTRFNENETGNINFRNVPKALILLYRCSTGEGWNQLMEDFANVRPPFCTVSDKFLEGDCGSPEWARALFISWNILSMYIFVNMFVSLIFESFSYVYQRSSGLAAIKRTDIRQFKQAWAEYDPTGKGFITHEQFPRLLAELSGIFDMRIYDDEYSVHRIMEDCKKTRRQSELPVEESRKGVEIDIHKLNAKLARMPHARVQERKRRLNVFYEEVLHSQNADSGISFNTLLMILAHYKIINDNKSLRLEEFLRRRARLQLVEDSVRRAIVANFMDMVFWTRRWRQHKAKRDAGRMTTIPTLQVPEIFIEDEDDLNSPSAGGPRGFDRPSLSLQIPGPSGSPSPSGSIVTHVSSRDTDINSNPSAHLRNRSDSVQMTPGSSPTLTRQSFNSISPTRSSFDRRPSTGSYYINNPDASASTSPVYERERDRDPFQRHGSLGPDDLRVYTGSSRSRSGSQMQIQDELNNTNSRSRANSSVSQTSMIDVLATSAWGESIRRSQTTRRGTIARRRGSSIGSNGNGVEVAAHSRASSGENEGPRHSGGNV